MPSHQGYQKVAQDTVVPENRRSSRSTMDKSITSETGGGNLPSTHSSQQLMPTDTESVTTSFEGNRISNIDSSQDLRSVNFRAWFSIGVLCFVNLINYMDRFTVASKIFFFIYLYLIDLQLRHAFMTIIIYFVKKNVTTTLSL